MWLVERAVRIFIEVKPLWLDKVTFGKNVYHFYSCLFIHCKDWSCPNSFVVFNDELINFVCVCIRMSRNARDAQMECKVYVGDLAKDAEEKEIERAFTYYGRLKSVWVARNPAGFAFVEFEDPRDAEDAVRGLDGTYVLSNITCWTFKNLLQIKKTCLHLWTLLLYSGDKQISLLSLFYPQIYSSWCNS